MSAQKNGSLEFGSVGAKYGQKTVTLSVAEMPSHTHPIANGGYPAIVMFTASGGNSAYMGQGSGSGVWAGPSGGGGAHMNIQPSVSTLLVIRT